MKVVLTHEQIDKLADAFVYLAEAAARDSHKCRECCDPDIFDARAEMVRALSEVFQEQENVADRV